MLFFGKTVDSIIADFDKKIEHLGIVAEARKAEAAVHDKAIQVRSELKALAEKEAARAVSIATRFKALLDGTTT